MDFKFLKDATNKPLVGYLHQSKILEGEIVEYKPHTNYIDNIEYINPLAETELYYNGTNHVITIFIPSNERYRLLLNIPWEYSGTRTSVTFDFITDSYGTVSNTYKARAIDDNSYVEFTTPPTTFYVTMTITSAFSKVRASIVKSGLIHKPITDSTYIYNSIYKTTDIDSAVVVDENGVIQSLDNFALTLVDDYIQVEGDNIDIGEYYLVYPTILDGDVPQSINYKEVINPVERSKVEPISVLYSYNNTIKSLFTLDKHLPIEYQTLCLREQSIIRNSDNTITFSISPEFDYLLSLSGTYNTKYSKISNEHSKIISMNKIATEHPIRYDNYTKIPYQIFSRNGDVIATSPNDVGLTVFINNDVIYNTNIKYIHSYDGIIELINQVNDTNIKVTYTTDPFMRVGLIKDLFTTRQNYSILLLPSNIYTIIVNGIDSANIHEIPYGELTLSDTYIDGDTYEKQYASYIDLSSGDGISVDSFVTNDNQYFEIIVAYTGSIYFELLDSSNSVLTTSATYTSTTLAFAVYKVDISSYDVAYFNIQTSADSHIYDIIALTMEPTEGGIYYTSDDYNLTNLYDATDTTTIDLYDYYEYIGLVMLKQYPYSSVYTFLQIDKRGGGLNEDKIIEEKTGTTRIALYPESYDYADIAQPDNIPLNPRKYLIVKLPTSIITDLYNKQKRIDDMTSDDELRAICINRVYSIVRKHLPSGAFFKIIDENDEPWPEETNI